MSNGTYTFEDGRGIHVSVWDDSWLAWLGNEAQTRVLGFPLEGVLMEVLGLDPTRDSIPREIVFIME